MLIFSSTNDELCHLLLKCPRFPVFISLIVRLKVIVMLWGLNSGGQLHVYIEIFIVDGGYNAPVKHDPVTSL